MDKFNKGQLEQSVYQIQGGHRSVIMHDLFAEVCNIFGVKEVDAGHFVVVVVKAIHLHQNKLLTKQTYANIKICSI